jgi:uncharacterized protein (TIGR02444 family)
MARPVDDFWRHSLRLYRRPEVEEACLWLQDRCGADVNVLLLCCHLGSRGREASPELLARAVAAVGAWRQEVLGPLRRVRRAIKAGQAGVPAAWAAQVRSGVKSAELLAERVEQRILVKSAGAGRRSRGDAALNLAHYRRLLGVSAGRAVSRRLALLAAAAVVGAPGER